MLQSLAEIMPQVVASIAAARAAHAPPELVGGQWLGRGRSAKLVRGRLRVTRSAGVRRGDVVLFAGRPGFARRAAKCGDLVEVDFSPAIWSILKATGEPIAEGSIIYWCSVANRATAVEQTQFCTRGPHRPIIGRAVRGAAADDRRVDVKLSYQFTGEE